MAEITPSPNAAKRFLLELFRGKPAAEHVLIWTLPGKKSSWYRELDGAARQAERLAAHQNVYFGIGLSPDDFGEGNRCPAERVTGIPGLWLDLDFGTAGHEKPNLPPLLTDAYALLRECGLPPTLVVHSGHGLQAYWLFETPWMFANPEERQQAQALSRDWSYTFKALARERKWDVDSVWDLARVLRVPGTINRKGDPVEVRILSDDGPRYAPGDFAPHFRELPAAKRTRAGEPVERVEVGGLVLDLNAEPPMRKFRALEANEPKFKPTVEFRRKDLNDQSPSAYDLALANIAVANGWTDQEIADLLIFWRSEQGKDPEKCLRLKYVQDTIGLARAGRGEEEAAKQLGDLIEESPPGQPLPADDKPAVREKLRRLLGGVAVERIEKYGDERPTYTLVTGSGEKVPLGGIAGVTSSERFRNSIAQAFDHYIPRMKEERWKHIAAALLKLVEKVDVGDAGLLSAQMGEWVQEYLVGNPAGKETEEAITGRQVVQCDEGTYFFLQSLLNWLRLFRGLRLENDAALGEQLRGCGCKPVRRNVYVKGKRTTRNVWFIPTP